jgi:hypothetical protein
VTDAIDKLDKYFSKTWNGLIQAAAIALDPRAKFVFWENSNLQRQDIDAGRETVRLAWHDFRPPVTAPPTYSARTLFGQGVVQQDQFTNYITAKTSLATDDFDVLEYWKMREAEYPNLSKMARKHLAVCASSTPCERSFSQAPLIIPYLRDSLQPDLFRTRMLLWSMQRLLDEDVLQ